MEHFRTQVLERIRAELFGPSGGRDEEIAGRPYWRYLCGMLFPVDVDPGQLGDDDEKDPTALGDEGEADASVALAYEGLPSSMGVSFYLRGAERLTCELEAARYEPIAAEQDRWKRQVLGEEAKPYTVLLRCPPVGVRESIEEKAFGGLARVSALFRPRGDGHLVTISLVNAQNSSGSKPSDQIERMLFQCRFRARVDGGSIGEYPTVANYAQHPEDEELAFAYRHRKTYGIGHGCAATWSSAELEQAPVEIVAEPLPVFEVRPLTNDIVLPTAASRVLSLKWLAQPERRTDELRDAFDAFIATYESWIAGQEAAAVDPSAKRVTQRIIAREKKALARMRLGVEVLARDRMAAAAFRLAQEAMLRQFLWTSRRGVAPRDVGTGFTEPIDPWNVPESEEPRWRPFQLAFQLLAIESMVLQESADRETLDLLWFPTGGGKTEAYLALAAFEIAHRRMKYQAAGAGTSVLMRYTLRLLTSQQFERAATMISVLETMRRQDRSLGLGTERISLGLWVGGATTPNRLDHDTESNPGAVQLLRDRVLVDETPENPFQLRTCPHCGTRIIPGRKSPRRSDYGIEITASIFRMHCPDPRCLLHSEIPVSVVDEDLLLRPPTFLIGTIDKFARMVWDARSRVFLGQGAGDVLPPTLVIQDELHLITGPLGTIAGLYESGIDAVIRLKGVVPKYLAATATIQRAHEQCRSLYARNASVFPPPGLDVADSFFSREDRETAGRKFIGAMGHGLYSSLTSLIQVSSAAACAVSAIDAVHSLARDSYWTQVIYHNSRQELGKTTTMLRDDVRSRLAILEPNEDARREFERIEELSANLKGAAVSEALERLQVQYPSPDVIDAVACTNMISVGIDVARLGLMIVKGQPKSTSEYIQASSRVGRDHRRPPGVVIALYSATRPRDRSHYEGFQAYHQALYRAVEPTTVTPFSPPARDRALHAALVLALRHSLGWLEPRDAVKFDPDDPAVRSVVTALLARLTEACRDDEAADVQEHYEHLQAEWADEARLQPPPPLSFDAGKQFRRLLAQFPTDGNDPGGLWPTLNSMRHVDGEVRFEVRGEEGGHEA